MAILIDETKRVLVQGITGREGRARTQLDARIRDECCRWCNARQRLGKQYWVCLCSTRRKKQ